MGINNVALKTFSSTGAQSVCRSNIADSTKIVESQFITKCKNEYINGSGMSSISGQTTALLVSGQAPTTDEFRVANDCDAISEMILQMSVALSSIVAGSAARIHSKTFILDLINKIDVYMGGILIQTIRPADIYVRNSTELNSLVNYNQPLWTAIVQSNEGIFCTSFAVIPASSFTLDFAVSIPFAGRDKKMQRSFLNAGAYTNSLVVKVIYNKYTSSTNLLASSAATITPSTTAVAEINARISTSLVVFTHNITETEKNFIQSNIINRIVNTSQSVVTMLTSLSSKISINLRDININVSHLLLCLNHPLFKPSDGTYVGGVALSPGSAGFGYTTGASTTFTNFGSMWSEISIIENGIASGMANVGVPTGWLKSAELIIGSDRTGEVSGSSLLANNLESFGLNYTDSKGIYIFKTAEAAFSTAGISFSKCNSVQLVLTLNDAYITAITPIFNIGFAGPVISVTACGTQVQTTVGGSISLSA